MPFNLGQMLGAAAEGGIPAYNQSHLAALQYAGQEALGRALFMPGAQQMPPQAPPPGQQSMPAPRPQAAPQQPPPGPPQVVGNMFGGMPGWAPDERPVEMGAPPMGQMPPPQQAPPPAPPPGVGRGAPPPAGGAPPAGVGMHDPILARIAAANPGAPPQVLMSAYSQYVAMSRSRYGLDPNIRLQAQNLRARELGLREQDLQVRAQKRAAAGLPPEQQPAAAPVQRAVNPQTGQTIILRGGQWVDEQSGQPLAAPAKPGKQSAADNTEFSSQARGAGSFKDLPRGATPNMRPQLPAPLARNMQEGPALPPTIEEFRRQMGRDPITDSEVEFYFGADTGMDKKGVGRQKNMPPSERFWLQRQ